MRWWHWLAAVALTAGILLRVVGLDLRPMHTDEAVHGVKFGDLLEHGVYRYDKNEYHGPTLNYFSLIPAFFTSERSLEALTEPTLRIVPVFFSLLLIGLFVLLIKDVGWEAVALGVAITALSPSETFYSRYYIQETLLVCFSFGFVLAGWRLLTDGRTRWAVLSGLFAGLMIATKETWLISAGGMIFSLAVVVFLRRMEHRPVGWIGGRNLLVVLFSAIAVGITFYSSFFTHWQGVTDSIRAYSVYFNRAGESATHGEPWYYYLAMIFGARGWNKPFWSEAIIVVFAVAGLWIALRKKGTMTESGRDLLLFLGIYGVILLIIYSAMPYKTPWLVLGMLQPLIVVAGNGVATIFGWLEGPWIRSVGILLFVLVVGHLGWQAYDANFVDEDNPLNPYVYAQPTVDVKLAADVVTEIARLSPQGLDLPVQVVYTGDGYWPLPWYLRSLKKVGWWNTIDSDFTPTPVILTSPEFEPELSDRVYQGSMDKKLLYVPLFVRPVYLRPGAEIRGYITLDLWNKIQTGRKS